MTKHKSPNFLTKNLCRTYLGEGNFKQYPWGIPTHTSTHCTQDLAEKRGVEAAEVKEYLITETKTSLETKSGLGPKSDSPENRHQEILSQVNFSETERHNPSLKYRRA